MKNILQSYANRMQNEKCILSLDILTDIHVTLPIRQTTLDNALEDIWLRKCSHVAILGDLSSNGLTCQLKQCLSQLKEFPYRYMIALGNHDNRKGNHAQVHIHPLYKELVLHGHHHIYYDIYVSGLHFYVLNSEQYEKANAYYSSKQLAWLKEHLQQDDPTKPVFILCHHPLQNTHLHSDETELSSGFQSDELKHIMSIHPHVIFISGHIHNSYEQCKILVDHTIFEIDVPSFRNTQYGNKKEEIGYHLMIFHDFLYLKTRNYKRHEWILSHEFILDIKTHQFYPFDAEMGQVPLQK